MPQQPDGSFCGILGSDYITSIHQTRTAIFSEENIKKHFKLLTLDPTFKKNKEGYKVMAPGDRYHGR